MERTNLFLSFLKGFGIGLACGMTIIVVCEIYRAFKRRL